MIRDPSDGSVREPTPEEDKILRKALVASGKVVQPVLDTATSGLPAAAARDADRHQRSKEWLADYRAGKFKPKSEETT